MSPLFPPISKAAIQTWIEGGLSLDDLLELYGDAPLLQLNHGEGILHLALASNKKILVQDLLKKANNLKYSALLHLPNHNRETPLRWALLKQRKSFLPLIINHPLFNLTQEQSVISPHLPPIDFDVLRYAPPVIFKDWVEKNYPLNGKCSSLFFSDLLSDFPCSLLDAALICNKVEAAAILLKDHTPSTFLLEHGMDRKHWDPITLNPHPNLVFVRALEIMSHGTPQTLLQNKDFLKSPWLFHNAILAQMEWVKLREPTFQPTITSPDNRRRM